MRKITLYIATSLDGFIARKDGSVDWLDSVGHVEGEDYGYSKFYKSIDTVLMGNGTYRWIVDAGVPFPYPDKKNYVFSKQQTGSNEHVTFISEDIGLFTKKLKEDAGHGIWLVGGAQVNSTLLNAKLIDEMIITTIPIALGEGIPLFGYRPNDEFYWKLKIVVSFDNGISQSTYTLTN